MSIVALKRKTLNGNPRMAPISGCNAGSLGFSLNGTRRNIGLVGPTNLGSTGKSCCTNDSNVIKPSVKTTKGMLTVRYINCAGTGVCYKNIVQPMNSYNLQHKSAECYLPPKLTTEICVNTCKHPYIGGKNVFKGNYTKPPNVAISHSEYIKTRYLKNKCIPPTPEHAHFPPKVNNKACATIYKNQNEM